MTGTYIQMSNLIHIKSNSKLSPKHIEFNKLVQTIEKLRDELSREEQKLEIFSEYYVKNILPLMETNAITAMDLALVLDEVATQIKLPKAVITDMEIIIPELINKYFEYKAPDEKAKALFEKWADVDYDEMVQEEKEEQLEELSDFMQSMGIDIDLGDLDFDDPESLGKIHERLHQAKVDIDEKLANRKTSRKKTKKQLEAEEISKIQEELKNKNLRSVYLSLAKILHPDSETDPELKAEKEEIMKQVTKAYEDKDIITMLVIETHWLKNTEERLFNIKEDVAVIYIELLKEQAKKLRQQKSELRYHARFQHVSSYVGDKTDRGILKMSLLKSEIEKEIRNTKKEIDIIKSSPNSEVKKFIKSLAKKYYVDPMDDFINFFNAYR